MINSFLPAQAETESNETKQTENKTTQKQNVKQDAKKEFVPTPLAESNDTAAKDKEDKTYHFLDGISGTMALTTNYMFRGISQTENYPAVQGSLTYTSPIGIYLNLWGSNVKFEDTNASVEIDTVVGYSNGIGENFTYDINYGRYNYPGATNLEYNELNTLFNFYFLQAGISYSGNVYNSHKSGTYYNGGINYAIPPHYLFNIEDVTFQALIGHYSLPRAAGNSYNDYNVGLSKKLNKTYTVAGQWISTNGRAKNPPYDDSQIVGTVTAEF